MVSVVLHFPPDVRHDLFVSLLVIELVLLIAGQSLQTLPRLDEHGVHIFCKVSSPFFSEAY